MRGREGRRETELDFWLGFHGLFGLWHCDGVLFFGFSALFVGFCEFDLGVGEEVVGRVGEVFMGLLRFN